MKPQIKQPARAPAPTIPATAKIISLKTHFAPRNDSQSALVEIVDRNKVTLSGGPAGTGKTYVAIAKAVRALQEGFVDKLILTRPAVAAGESIGFLPGDADEKLMPYMMPLYDALSDFMPLPLIANLKESGQLEIIPVGFMRGRTLKNAFIIGDEMQNTTRSQAKMVYTRIGPNSKMVLTGDATQCDLTIKPGELDGFSYLERALTDVFNVGIHRALNKDVVREEVVRDGLDAMDRFDLKLSHP